MEFSEWLKSARAVSGMSVDELAQRARLSKPLLYHYEKGKRLPTPDSAQKLANALGVDVAEIAQYARQSVGRPGKAR